MVQQIIKSLPEDKRQWHYNYNSLYNVRPILNKLTEYYIMSYKRKEFDELVERLDKEEKILKETYGESSRYANYKENKIADLYTRMGNTVLQEIKNHVKAEEELQRLYKQQEYLNNNTYNFSRLLTIKGINKIKKSFDDDFNNIKNQRIYERLEYEIEQER